MDRDELVALTSATVRDFALATGGQALADIGESTCLFGETGFLDSIGLVSVVLDLEQQVNERLGLSISLADDRAMSQSRSPFRSVGSLADYVLALIHEQQAT